MKKGAPLLLTVGAFAKLLMFEYVIVFLIRLYLSLSSYRANLQLHVIW